MADLGQRFSLQDLQVGDFMQHGRHSDEIYEIVSINHSANTTMIRRANVDGHDSFGYGFSRFEQDSQWRKLSTTQSRALTRFMGLAKFLVGCEERQGETQASLHEILMRLEV